MSEADPPSDQELVAAINAGDAAAFNTLYYRYRDWVVRLAYRITRNRDDALDVLQETFTYAWKKFPGFQLTASMTTVLYPVVRHQSLAARRKAGRFVSIEDLPAEIIDPETRTESSDDLAAFLAVLPASRREVLLKRFVDGMSLDEIAAVLEIPLGTVKSRLHNSLAALREDPRTKRHFFE